MNKSYSKTAEYIFPTNIAEVTCFSRTGMPISHI